MCFCNTFKITKRYEDKKRESTGKEIIKSWPESHRKYLDLTAKEYKVIWEAYGKLAQAIMIQVKQVQGKNNKLKVGIKI